MRALPGWSTGTTRCSPLAQVIGAARAHAQQRGCVATVGKVRVEPNGVNAIPSRVLAWLDARGPAEDDVRAIAEAVAAAGGTRALEESFTTETALRRAPRGAPVIGARRRAGAEHRRRA